MADDIGEWLDGLGLGGYAEAFARNDVDFRALRYLDRDDLKELGVSLGHRKVLLAAIAELGAAATAPTGREDPPTAGVERRQLTVMFCDLVGSTALSGRLDPEDYREVIRTFQETCARTVREHGGYVAKHLGDGLLAYFGYPRAQEDDAERAVRAGLALAGAVAGLQAPEPLRTRVGIETGLVVIGELVGEGISEAGAISGETPNLAARLEQLAAPGEVVVGPTAWRILGGAFDVEDMGPRGIKGIAAPVRAARITGERRVQSRFEARQVGTLTALVGREAELDTLLRRWGEARDGEGQVVLISGEPGIGKSRLTQELRERIAEPHTRLRYQCSPHHTNSALYPVIGQLTFAAGIESDEAAASKLDKLEALIARATDVVGEVAPLFADLLSIPSGERYPPLNYTPQRHREETLAALTEQFANLAAARPLLVIYEDVHWIDPTTQELLDRKVRRIAELPALILITFRPEYEPPWMGQAHVTTLALNRLSRRLSAEMSTRVAQEEVLGEAVLQDIVVKTEGVPLFVEELTKAVLEAGPGAPDAARASALQVPATVQDSLTARLDRLGSAKEVAQLGAVIGRTFPHELLAAVSDGAEDLRAALARLTRAELVTQRGAGADASYTFKHALIQDAAYESLLRGRRRELHTRVAEVAENRFPTIAENEPELIAHHYTEAGLPGPAIEYWHRAGQRAMRRSANIEAEGHLRRGLALLADLPEDQRTRHEIALQNTLGVCMMPTRGFSNPEVADVFSRAAALCEEAGDERGLFAALRGRGQYQMISGDMRAACDQTHRILDIAAGLGDHGFTIEAHHLGWSALCFAGDYHAARAHAEQGIALYDRERDHQLTYAHSGHDPGMCCRAFGSLSLCQLGYPDQALALCREGRALAESLAHPFTLAIALWGTGILYQMRREATALRETGERLVSYCGENGIGFLVQMGRVFRGAALAAEAGGRREAAEGVAEVREGLDGLHRYGTEFGIPSFHAALAEACASAGEVAAGLVAVEAGLAMSAKNADRFCLPELHRVKGVLTLAAARGDQREAEAYFTTAIEIAREQEAKLLELRAASDLATLWAEQGKAKEARDLLAPVYGWFTEGFDTPDLKEAKALLDELH